jgi:glycine/D-amino acid oxidase-like deaminating enzyme/nitrite reductase/ring-hydroxylating ferredoxin subunit
MAPTERASLWTATAEVLDHAPLAGTATADVAVIGAGIVGMTLADLLKRAGRTVAVIESRRVGAQVTGRSTAKLTALQGATYRSLIAKHGKDVVRAYARANQAAVEYVAQRVEETGIECDLHRAPAFTCAVDAGGLGTIREEAQAAGEAGLPVDTVTEAPLPFEIAGAVRLDDQIAFHPQRYVNGLARLVDGDGSQIFGHTRALSLDEGSPTRVITDRGTVMARDVVVTTNLPFLDRGLHFAKAYPRQHAVLAARIPEDKVPGGMFLCIDQPTWSVRSFYDDSGPVLVITGPGGKPGRGDHLDAERWLEDFARERFDAGEILNRWTNEDYDSMDGLPFVGRMPMTDRVWLATGFSAWGLSNGTAAAHLLADLLDGRPNELAAQWDARRWNLKAGGGRFMSNNLEVGREMVGDRISALRAPHSDELARGAGGLVRHQGRLVAAYRDEAGTLTTLSPYCTHLRCLLSWDPAAGLWECPCHGSIFDREGRVVHGPAVRDLRRRD